MLILDAEIYFDRLSENPDALPHDIRTNIILRPAINFGNGLLFSGTIKSNRINPILERGQTYLVMIEMPTIEQEALSSIKDLLYVGGTFKIQNGSRVIGNGNIQDFVYE